MKKLTALLLALVFLTMALVACDGGDASPAGKTFTFEKVDVKITNSEYEEQLKEYLGDTNLSDYYKEAMKDVSLSFTEDKVTLKGMAETLNSPYTMDGEKIVISEADMENIGGSMIYKDGKVIMEMETAGVSLKVYFK